MATGNPLIGEVWSMQDGTTGEHIPALIVAPIIGADAFQLIGRSGRVINVPRRTLTLSWSYLRPAFPDRCTAPDCSDVNSYLRTVDGRSFCAVHVPRNQALLLPGDSVEDARQTIAKAFEQCPLCQAPRDANSPWQVVEDLHLYLCACRGRWVRITPKGSIGDGLQIGEDLQTAHALLETELCGSIRARIGPQAALSLRRSFRELTNQTHDTFRFAGIPLEIDGTLGDSLVVYGAPAASNDQEAAFRDLPLDSYWQHKQREYRILRLIGVQETSRNDRQVTLNNVLNESELVQMTEAYLRQVYQQVPQPDVRLNSLGEAQIRFPPDPWMSFHDAEVPTLDTHETVLTVRENANETSQPTSGELWWNTVNGTPVSIFGVGADLGTFVRFSLDDGGVVRMLREDFLKVYFRDDLVNSVKIGDEYEHLETEEVYKVGAITPREVELQLTAVLGDPLKVTLGRFRSEFRKLSRRSAMDRLLQDDDLV